MSHPSSAGARLERDWVAAFAGVRPIEARLAPAAYAPYRSGAALDRARHQFLRELPSLAQEVRRSRSPALTRRLVLLMAFADGNLDQAAAAASEAVRDHPRSAFLLNDLAAVHLCLAGRRGEPRQLVLALDAADRALALAPRLSAAAFNRALALDRLNLSRQAAAAWAALAARETDGGWAGEDQARQRAAAALPATDCAVFETVSRHGDHASFDRLAPILEPGVIRQAVARCPQAARLWIDEVGLPAWAGAVVSGRSMNAQLALTAARKLSREISRASGETMAVDTIAVIDKARGTRDGRQLRVVALGHQAYGRGLARVRRHAYIPAAAWFGRADRLLTRAGSPFAAWARLQQALCVYQQTDYAQAAQLLGALIRGAPPSHLALRGRALRTMATIRSIEGRPIESLDAARQSRAYWVRLHETGGMSAMDTLATEDLLFLGRLTEAWQALALALAEARGAGNGATWALACESLLKAAEHDGLLFAARDIADALVDQARGLSESLWLNAALHDRAALGFPGSGAADLALRDLAEGRRLALQIPDPRVRQTVAADLLVTEGLIWRGLAPARAVAPLTAALAVYRRTGYRFELAEALLALCRARLASGESAGAEEALGEAVVVVERQRQGISDVRSRDLFAGENRRVFDALADFELRQRHRPDLALAVAEAARPLAMLDVAANRPAPAPSAQDPGREAPPTLPPRLLAALPPHLLLVEYFFSQGRLMIWALSRDALQSFVVDANEEALATLVRRLTASIARGADGGAAGARLYDILIRPCAALLHPGDDLVVVPDGTLEALPFAALRDGNRYLVEQHAVSVAPSASFFATQMRRQPQASLPRTPTLLAVGDPAFAPTLFPDLPRLPGAAQEARGAAGLMPGSIVLTGAEATPQAFFAAASRCSFIHFGGHILVNADYPLLSQLVLAPDLPHAASGILYARDVLRHRFPHARLVVLAGCRSASGSGLSGTGIPNLAAAFLSTGVPAVLAYLWVLDDQQSAAFLHPFYRRLAAGWVPVAALRAAQIELLRGDDPFLRAPRAWAGFEIFGSELTRATYVHQP